jgi:hypothetical protein
VMTTVAGLGGGGSPKSRKYTTHAYKKSGEGIDERVANLSEMPLGRFGFSW